MEELSRSASQKVQFLLGRAVWTEEEDSALMRLVEINGKKWSFVSKHLDGRTENQVKNRYIAILKKSLKKHHRLQSLKS